MENNRLYTETEMTQFAFQCVANFLSNDENKLEMKLVDIIIDRNNEELKKFLSKLKT